MAGASSPYQLLREEFVQRRDEGCDIPAELTEAFNKLDEKADSWNNKAIDSIYDELMILPDDPELATAEPNELEAIRALRPDGPRDFNWQPLDEELIDRLHGAWTGRAVGCALGKPVECRAMTQDKSGRCIGRQIVKEYLMKRDDWPLNDYFSNRDVGDGDTLGCSRSHRENIKFMEGDDDIHYSLAGLGVLELYGPDFTWNEVALYWFKHIPLGTIWTAEMQAVLNLLNNSRKGGEVQVGPEYTRRYRNPYREWIGAQIRADGWAYCCAGRPELAAEYAWRDAHWTHERNGIYGEMMFAAIESAAFVESDPAKLVEIGLSEIPADCRLAQWVKRCLVWINESSDFEACMDKMEAELGYMHPVHTINNALICIIAMFFGKMKTNESIAISVMCGLDTDCNGATVGSIVGAVAGRANFGEKLASRLNDVIYPEMLGFQKGGIQKITMRELAERCAAIRNK